MLIAGQPPCTHPVVGGTLVLPSSGWQNCEFEASFGPHGGWKVKDLNSDKLTRLNSVEGSWACFTNCFHSFCFSNNVCVDPLVFIYGILGLQVCAYIPDCLFRTGSYYVVFCPGTQRSSCLCRFLCHPQVLSRNLIVVISFLRSVSVRIRPCCWWVLLWILSCSWDSLKWLEDAVTSKAGITSICLWLCF